MLGARPLIALAIVPLLIGFVACRAASTEDEPQAKDNDIIGGVDARGASLDAIGALAIRSGTQEGGEGGAGSGAEAGAGGFGTTYEPFCTGTLIGPRAILTAKHCVFQTVLANPEAGTPDTDQFFHETHDVVFAIGSNARAPKKAVKVIGVETCNLEGGGFAGLGCDVAVLRLEASIDDITPLGVARAHVEDSAVGQKRIAVGYGIQDSAGSAGTRKAGSLTVRATRGNGLQSVFPTLEAFIEAYRVHEGRTFTEQLRAQLELMYNTPLVDGYELWAGAGEDDAQVCDGDSGGPLLAKVDGKNVVIAVASTAVKGIRLPCNLGGSYATFGPKAQEIISRAVSDPCNGTSENGKCEGAVAVRCTKSTEGNRRLTRIDCSDLGQRCEVPDGGPVECVD